MAPATTTRFFSASSCSSNGCARRRIPSVSLLSAADAEVTAAAGAAPAGLPPAVAVFTGGGDSHYAIPLVCSLAGQGMRIDVIGSEEFDTDRLRRAPNVVLHRF